jgi:hypothetical protein
LSTPSAFFTGQSFGPTYGIKPKNPAIGPQSIVANLRQVEIIRQSLTDLTFNFAGVPPAKG